MLLASLIPISSTDSPGSSANSFIKSRAYGAVSSGRKCRARLSHSKESSARCRAACRRIHSPFQSAESNSERASPSATGQPPSNKKATPPKEEPQQAYIRKRTDPTPNRLTSQVVQERSNCNRDRTQLRSHCAGAPGRQIYKVDREYRTSRRALNVLSVRVRTVRAGDLIYLPPRGSSPVPLS